jgi:hypothetical protein
MDATGPPRLRVIPFIASCSSSSFSILLHLLPVTFLGLTLTFENPFLALAAAAGYKTVRGGGVPGETMAVPILQLQGSFWGTSVSGRIPKLRRFSKRGILR